MIKLNLLVLLNYKLIKKLMIMEKKQERKNTEKELIKANVLEQYKAQTEKDDDIHYEHIDWTYGDSSGCCC